MKKLLLLALCLVALAGRVRAQATRSADIVVVRIEDIGTTVKAIINRGEGKTEKVEFNRGPSDAKMVESSEGYYKLLRRLYDEGYALQGVMGTGASVQYTLFFIRKP